MTLDDIIKVVQIFQAIAISFAGLWAIYTFRVLREKNKADLQVVKLELDLEKTEKELSSKPQLTVNASSKTIRNSEGALLGIHVSIKLENTGNVFEFIDLSKSEVKARLYDLRNEPNVGSFARSRMDSLTEGLAMWPSEYVYEEAFIPTSDEGLYIIDCSFVVSKESNDLIMNAANKEGDYSLSFGCGLYFDTYA